MPEDSSKKWSSSYFSEGEGGLTTVVGAEEERWGLHPPPFQKSVRPAEVPSHFTERVDNKFEEIFFQSGDGLLIYDVDGAILQANDTLAEMLRYSRGELLDLSIIDLYPVDSIEIAHYMTDSLLEQGSLSLEVSFKRKNSQTFSAEVNASLCDYGPRKAILLSVRDITTRKQMEEALRYLQQSIDQVVDAIYWVRETGQLEFVNEGAGNLLGFSKVELLSMKFQDIDLNFTAQGWEAHWDELKTRASFYSESWHHSKRGHVIPVEMSWNFVEVYGRQLACVVSRNISQRKKQEARIVLGREEAELIGFARAHYSGQLSEQMKEPLQTLLRRMKYLEAKLAATSEPEVSSDSEEEGEHLLALAEQLERLAENGQGAVQLEPGKVALASLLEEVIDQVQESDGVSSLQISLECPDELISLLVDGSKMKKALVHLIRGFFSIRPEEQLWIRVVATEKEGKPLKIEFSQLFSSTFAEVQQGGFAGSVEAHAKSGRDFDLSVLIARALVDLLGYELQEGLHEEAGYACTLLLEP